jgi:quercetin dioxygenase-like cupin family protein
MGESVMKKLILGAAVAFGLAVAASSLAAGAEPRIIGRYISTFSNVQPPGRYFDLIQGVSEFKPGAAARPNSLSASPRFFTVIEGSVDVRIGEKSAVYGAGQSFSDPAGIVFAIGNAGDTRARVLFSILAPAWEHGAQPAPGSQAPAAPSSILFTVRTDIVLPAEAVHSVNVVQVVQDWDPGAANAPHVMNHQHVFTAVEGELTTHYLDGTSQRVTAGQLGIMQPGKPGTMQNEGQSKALVVVTWVQTPGTPLTSPVGTGSARSTPAPSTGVLPPSTGDAGLHRSGTATDRPGLKLLTFAEGGAVFFGMALALWGLRVRRYVGRRD